MGLPLSQLQIDDFDIAILVPGHRYWRVGSPFVFAQAERQRQATRPSLRCAAFSTARAGRPTAGSRLARTTRASPSVKRYLALIDRVAINQGGLCLQRSATGSMLNAPDVLSKVRTGETTTGHLAAQWLRTLMKDARGGPIR